MTTSWVAIDPGGVTGAAKLTQTPWGLLRLDVWEIPDGRFGFLDWFKSFDVAGVEQVFVEDFIITTGTVKKTQQVDPWRLVGYLEGWAHVNRVPLTLQAPATAKNFSTDAKLKYLGWHRPTPGGHQNDACRHLLLGLRNERFMQDALLGFAESL